MQREVTFAGFGGQGIMTAGKLLALAGMAEGKEVCWIPSYGPEMRGGTAYCTVVVADRLIGSPIVNDPECAFVFNRPSLDKFGPRVKPGGLLLINSSLIDVQSERKDITQVLVPCNDIANELKNGRSINLVGLGAFVARSGMVSVDVQRTVLQKEFGKKKGDALKAAMEVFEAGVQAVQGGGEAVRR
jgi:2-oxoglutarate ferredoxin oxidoreductase subunit gamma